MTRSRIYWLLMSAGVVLAVSLIVLSPASPAVAQGVKNALVQVVNEPSNPVPISDVHNPACSPFQLELVIAVPNGQTHVTESFTVPRNRRLVIEHVSASGFGQGFIRTHVTTTANGEVAQHFLVNVQQGTSLSGTSVFNVSQPTRWYADPGTEVHVTSSITPPNGADTLVTLSGYLVECR